MLECLDLSDQFVGVATNFRRKHFNSPDHEIRVYNKTAADVHSCRFIIYPVHTADFTAPV